MFVPAMILILSVGLLLFYFQVVCERILRRQSTHEYSQVIVNANRLEFQSVRKAIEDFGTPVDFSRLTVMLKCDFLILTYLLKNATNVYQRCTSEERLLMLYFRVEFAALVTRHWLRRCECPAILKMTSILQYFADIVGERVSKVRFGSLKASDLLNI